MNSLIVSRLGGDAAATSETVKKAADIILSDPSRRYVIVSAPAAIPGSVGITDLLYLCHSSYHSGEGCMRILDRISARYKEIVSGLGINFNVSAEISALKGAIELGVDLDYVGSRGEYIMAKIFAEYLGWDFVDAHGTIFFNADGTPDRAKTFKAAAEKLNPLKHAIIPSFYGTSPDNRIKTFKRGDCDSAGALIACSVKADLFEKWSETARVFSADPSVIPEAELVSHITYREALEMNYVGINIVNDNVAIMLDEARIPMRIASIDSPDEGAMLISPDLPEDVQRNVSACIAGHKNFTVVHISKYGLNKDYSFDEKLFGLFAKHRIACQHYLTGIHQMAVLLKTPLFDLKRGEIFSEIRELLSPDSITVEKGLSLIAVIGEAMGTTRGLFSIMFEALAIAGINVVMAEHGADKQNVIIGVLDSDYEAAIKALYKALIL